jgi:hypothetical protein
MLFAAGMIGFLPDILDFHSLPTTHGVNMLNQRVGGNAMAPLTFFEKVWNDHVIADLGENTALLSIDRLFLHEMSGSVAVRQLEASGRPPAHPEQVFPSSTTSSIRYPVAATRILPAPKAST